MSHGAVMKPGFFLLVESPFTKRDYTRYGIEALSKSFSVYILDLTPWLYPHVWAAHGELAFRSPEYREIASADELRKALGGPRPLVLDLIGQGWNDRHARQVVKAEGGILIRYDLGPTPVPQRSIWTRLWRLKFRTNVFRPLLRGVVKFVQNCFYHDITPDILILSGNASLLYPGAAHARHIWAHSLDYEVYLGMRDEPQSSQQPYAVFVDEDLAFHSDFLHLGFKPLVTPELYYSALMAFFDRFEAVSGMKVVFAAHPRAKWEERLHLLKGRVPVYGQTAKLISGAKLCFLHVSTSTSFAVLFNVPVIFLVSEELRNSAIWDEIEMRRHMLNAPLVDIDHPQSGEEGLESILADTASYSDYREGFIKKSGTQDIAVWEIFAAHVFENEQS